MSQGGKSPQTGAGISNGIFSRHAVCLVLDYGSQYTQLIARRIRDNGVLSMLLPGDVSLVCDACDWQVADSNGWFEQMQCTFFMCCSWYVSTDRSVLNRIL